MHDAVTTFLLAFVSALASALCGYLISQIRNKTKKRVRWLDKESVEIVSTGRSIKGKTVYDSRAACQTYEKANHKVGDRRQSAYG